MSTADNPGVLAPPPLLYLGFLAAGLGLDWLWPAALLPQAVQYPLGAALVASGAAIMAAALRRFRKAATDFRTHRPATALVTGGPYRLSRNPIYIALTLFYLGLAVVADSPWALALVVPLLAVMRYGVVGREERYLESKFGEPYREYKARVRRWL